VLDGDQEDDHRICRSLEKLGSSQTSR
jgi:hypothetical protein